MAVEVPQWLYDQIKFNRDSAQMSYDGNMQAAREQLAALHNWQAVLDDLVVEGQSDAIPSPSSGE